MNTNGIVSQNADRVKSISGRIEAIAPVVIEGTTHYYVCLTGTEDIFDVDLSDETLLGIIRYQTGEQITLGYMEGYGLHSVKEIH